MSHTRHLNPVPLPWLVLSAGGPSFPCPISKRTRFAVGSGTGRTQVSRPLFFPSQKLRTSGIVERHAGFGHVTVLAQSHAITVACFPSGSVAFGYKCPIRRSASSRIH